MCLSLGSVCPLRRSARSPRTALQVGRVKPEESHKVRRDDHSPPRAQIRASGIPAHGSRLVNDGDALMTAHRMRSSARL